MNEISDTDNFGDNAEKMKYEQDEKKLDIISNIPLQISCILGTATLNVSQLLKLSKGSVIELDKNVGEPVDLMVNGKLVARGEVVIIENQIGITLTEVISLNT